MSRPRVWAALTGWLLARVIPWLLLTCATGLVFSQLKTPTAVLQLWRPWGEVGVLACGMTAIVLTGGIDLSVGSIVALSGVVLGTLWHEAHWPLAAACVGALASGFLAGALNGTLIRLGIAPLVVTLATMAGFSGLAMALSGGQRISGFPHSFAVLGQGAAGGIPLQLWLLGATWALACVLVHFTRIGRYLYAIGDNRTAAALAGVPVGRLEWWLYTLNGLLAGSVAIMYTARGGASVPNAAAGLELQVIACVVLGGTRVTGGAGGPGRTLLGLAILSNLEIGLRLVRRLAIPIPGTHLTWELTANGRLVVIGMLLIALAAFNERANQHIRPASD